MTKVHTLNLSKLLFMDLSDNSLALSFSPDWSPSVKLQSIFLKNCKLGPHFPNWLRNQKLCSELDISIAGISDAVPNWFWDFSSSLYYLNVPHNQLKGILPDLSSKFSGFPGTDLSYNCFEGPIPPISPNMTGLILSKNSFSGTISVLCARWIGDSLANLIVLSLRSNQIHGSIPEQLCDLAKLQIVDFSYNKVSGKMLNCLGNITAMAQTESSTAILTYPFDFAAPNEYFACLLNYTDQIPAKIGELTLLNSLDLSSKKLNGKIPESFSQSGHLELCGSPLSKKCKEDESSQDPAIGGVLECRIMRKDS
ncbi:receptor-like protein EIX1 [Mangifera indica]|uniref:receptor-like protein EIX1 n=1 Tax=Mangifera indica TaxID=29780 RepID=UPI001CFC212B|nr:receptor-like protein EIX1 [Mangifera indica]